MKIQILLISLVLSGCDSGSLTTNFQLMSSSNGEIYRLNKNTGEIHTISDGVLIKIHESNRIMLSNNIILETENKDTYEYKGNGKFIKRNLTDPEKMAEDMLHEMGL